MNKTDLRVHADIVPTYKGEFLNETGSKTSQIVRQDVLSDKHKQTLGSIKKYISLN